MRITRFAGLVLLLLVATTSIPAVAADAPAGKRTHPKVATKWDPANTEFTQREPIRFKEFPMVRPGTEREPIGRDEMIVVPVGDVGDDRKVKVRAGEYFDKLNEFEKYLNARGYTLRAPGEIVFIQRSRVDRAELWRDRCDCPYR